MRNSIVNAAAYALCAIVAASVMSHAASAQDKIPRGEYLATIMDCGGCHCRARCRCRSYSIFPESKTGPHRQGHRGACRFRKFYRRPRF